MISLTPESEKKLSVRSFTSTEENISGAVVSNRLFVIRFDDGQTLEIRLYLTELMAGIYRFIGTVEESGKVIRGFYCNNDGSKKMMSGFGMARTADEEISK